MNQQTQIVQLVGHQMNLLQVNQIPNHGHDPNNEISNKHHIPIFFRINM